MTDDQELFTDFALQLFNSFLSNDINIMKQLLSSFRNDEKDYDTLFMPGLIYGLMYHLGNFLDILEEASEISKKEIMEDYSIQYAMEREYLLSNPLLNVKKASEHIANMMKTIEGMEDFFKDND